MLPLESTFMPSGTPAFFSAVTSAKNGRCRRCRYRPCRTPSISCSSLPNSRCKGSSDQEKERCHWVATSSLDDRLQLAIGHAEDNVELQLFGRVVIVPGLSVWKIREIERPIGAVDHVVRTVQRLPLILVHHGGNLHVFADADNTPVPMLAEQYSVVFYHRIENLRLSRPEIIGAPRYQPGH